MLIYAHMFRIPSQKAYPLDIELSWTAVELKVNLLIPEPVLMDHGATLVRFRVISSLTKTSFFRAS